jgi:hypothetical protein
VDISAKTAAPPRKIGARSLQDVEDDVQVSSLKVGTRRCTSPS